MWWGNEGKRRVLARSRFDKRTRRPITINQVFLFCWLVIWAAGLLFYLKRVVTTKIRRSDDDHPVLRVSRPISSVAPEASDDEDLEELVEHQDDVAVFKEDDEDKNEDAYDEIKAQAASAVEAFGARVLPEIPARWKPSAHASNNGYDIEDTIFIGIASYRDPMCADTVKRAIRRAKHPERLRFGVVEQNDPEIDESCDPCVLDSEFCKYNDAIRFHRVHASFARGPTFGRARADALYGGEKYALQIDAHMFFVQDWDVQMIDQFLAANNDKAVLSTYPTDSQHAMYEDGSARTTTTPAICTSQFEDTGKYAMIRHLSAHEFDPDDSFPSGLLTSPNEPIHTIWWAAGLSFSRGERIVQVPYDTQLDFLFHGEEVSMAVRMWTWGYDFYTFRRSLVFHAYNRKIKPHLFWENSNSKEARSMEKRAKKRVVRLMHVPKRGRDKWTPPKEPFRDELFDLGHVRRVERFYQIFHVNFLHHHVQSSCSLIVSGRLHAKLKPLVSKEHGVDYERLSIID